MDLERYLRRRLFECLLYHPRPVLPINTAIDISGFSAAINGSTCFRHRIVDDVLVECPRVHPSLNVALEDGGFSFANADYCSAFGADYASLRAAIEGVRTRPNQDFRGGLDDRFFRTHLPWLSFS